MDESEENKAIDTSIKSGIIENDLSLISSDNLSDPIEYNDEASISEIEILQKEIEDLYTEEHKLDGWINEIKTNFEKLNEDKSFKDYGYVTFEDLKALTLGEDINLIAVKATQGTSVEIPDPEQIHRIYLQSYEVI